LCLEHRKKIDEINAETKARLIADFMCFCAEVLKMAPAQAHFCAHFCADRRMRPRRTNSGYFRL
jgi:hypothetical protein